MNNYVLIAVIVVSMGIGALIYYAFDKDKTITVNNQTIVPVKITEVDYKQLPDIILDDVQSINDTTFVIKTATVTDTIIQSAKFKIASCDTTISDVRIKADYYYLPINKFAFEISKTDIVCKKNWITYGLQLGAGYGIFNKKPDVFIGFGLQLNF